MSLRKFSTRSLTARLGRTVLTIFAIVIGVTAVVSVCVMSETTYVAQKLMFKTVNGKATLEVKTAGNAGFDSSLVEEVRKVPGVELAAPLLDEAAKLMKGEQQVKLRLLGVDPKLDPVVRDYEISAGRMAEPRTDRSKPYQIVLDEGFAKQQNLQLGDILSMRTRINKFDLQLVGLAKPKGGASMRQMALAMVPIEDGDRMFNKADFRGTIQSIQIVTSADADVDQVAAKIGEILPEGLTVRPPTAGGGMMKRMLMSTEQSLFVSTVFSFVLAVFIILNTFFMNVGERRRQLAIMRAVGATGRQIMYTMLGEAVLLGVIGTLIGIPLGLGLAWGMNRSMSKGFDVILPDPQVTWVPIVLSIVLGVGASVFGAFVPAWRAGQVSPVEGLSRVSREDIEGSGRRYLVLGAILLALGGLTVYCAINGIIWIYLGPFGAVFLLVGVVFLSPLFLQPLVSVFAAVIKPFTRVEGEMALRQILRHQVRTQLTIGVLFVAAAVVVGMTISIKDNVRDVHDWFRASITADFIVRSLMPDLDTGASPALPDEVGDEILAIKQLSPAMIESIRFVQAKVLDKEGTEHMINVVAREFADPEPPAFDLTEGEKYGLREKLFDGQVVVGSILAHDLQAHVGDEIQIVGQKGPESVKIAAIANDYLVAGLTVYMQRKTAERILNVQGVDGYTIRTDNKEDLVAIRDGLAKITSKYSLLLQSNIELSHTIDSMRAGVELGMWAMVYIAFIVAMIGVVNTLTMNVLEQTRELSMLRIVAMTKAQVRKTILTQALLISTAGLMPGILVGILVAFIMNIAFEPSFGRRIEFHFYPGLLSGALVGAIAITLIAAWFPAQRAANVDLATALHYD
jgi:putative ABC transport system permease protein